MHNTMRLCFLAMFGGPAGEQGGQGNNPMFMIVWLGLLMALFYFMLIRPQQRKEKERRRMLEAVKSGDRVIFGGGLLGIVTNIKKNSLTVKIAENTKIEVLKGSVTRILQKDEDIDAEQEQQQ